MAPEPRLQTIAGWLLAGLALAWLGTYLWLGYPWTMVGSSNDGLHYLWSADALTRGLSHPLSAFGADRFWNGRFPPGYPLYLSLFGAGASSEGMRLANLAQMVSVIVLLVLILVLAIRATRSRWAGLLVLGYTLAHPMMTPWSLELFAEPLFASALITACLVADGRGIRNAWFWAALLVGCACLVRVMGLAALPALALWVWLQQRSLSRAMLVTLVALTPTLAWAALKAAVASGSGDHYLAQFRDASAAFSEDAGSFLLLQAGSFLRALAPAGIPDVLRVLVGGALLAAVLRAAWAERRHPAFATLIALPMLLLLLVWPFPEHLDRLAGPLVPLLLVLVLRHWMPAPDPGAPAPGAPRRWLSPVLATLVLASMAGALGMLWGRAARVDDPVLKPYLRNASVLRAVRPEAVAAVHHASLLLVAQLDRVVPRGDCVSTRFPAFAALRATVPLAVTALPFEWDSNPCRFVLGINLVSKHDGFDAYYPLPMIEQPFRTVLMSRESPEGLVYAALITTPEQAGSAR